MFKKTVTMFAVAAVVVICFSFANKLVVVQAAPPRVIASDAVFFDNGDGLPCQPQPCCYDTWITNPVKKGNCNQTCTPCYSPQACSFDTGNCIGDF